MVREYTARVGRSTLTPEQIYAAVIQTPEGMRQFKKMKAARYWLEP